MVKHLDHKWFSRTRNNLVSVQIDGEKEYRQDQMRKFLDGSIVNPVLDYNKIDLTKLNRWERNLSRLLQEIASNESVEIVREAYIDKISYELDLVEYYLSIHDQDMKRFKNITEKLYGKPDKDIFYYTVFETYNEFENIENPPKKFIEAFNKFKSLLPKPIQNSQVISPSQKDFTNIKNALSPFISFIETFNFNKDNYNAVELGEFISKSIKILNLGKWEIDINENSQLDTMSILPKKRTVKIPSQKVTSAKRLKELLAHEVGVHIARRINGERTSMKLLGLGLDSYLSGEEGLGCLFEQVLNNKFTKYADAIKYLAISLAYGLDGKPRDFREVYEVIYAYLLCRKFKEETTDDVIAASQKEAWQTCIRTFEGSDCKTKGVCKTRNLVYRKGNISAWNILKSHPKEATRITIGKYDPANKKHLWILDNLQLTDLK